MKHHPADTASKEPSGNGREVASALQTRTRPPSPLRSVEAVCTIASSMSVTVRRTSGYVDVSLGGHRTAPCADLEHGAFRPDALQRPRGARPDERRPATVRSGRKPTDAATLWAPVTPFSRLAWTTSGSWSQTSIARHRGTRLLDFETTRSLGWHGSKPHGSAAAAPTSSVDPHRCGGDGRWRPLLCPPMTDRGPIQNAGAGRCPRSAN